MYIIYHRSDLDGKCSAAIVNYFLHEKTELSFIGAEYGDSAPKEIFKSNKLIYILDYSYDRETMEKLKDRVIWIDHHKTAIEKLGDIDFFNKGVDQSVAACELTWKGFALGKKIPEAVRLISKYDIHEVTNDWDKVCKFQYGLKTCNTDPTNNDLWKELFENDQSTEHLISKGETVASYISKLEEHLSLNVYYITFHEFKTVVYNGPMGNNIIKKFMSKDCPIGIFYKIVNPNKAIVSLRSIGDIDVSEISKLYGGGGHKNAAGFTCDPELILKWR